MDIFDPLYVQSFGKTCCHLLVIEVNEVMLVSLCTIVTPALNAIVSVFDWPYKSYSMFSCVEYFIWMDLPACFLSIYDVFKSLCC